MTRRNLESLIDLGGQIVERARKAGADMAEVSVREGDHLSVKVRKGEAELVEEAGSRSVGLRVMRGQQVAVTYTSDLSEAGIARFVEDAIELAALSQPDPFAGPPDPSLLSKRSEHRDLDTYDETMSKIGAGDAIKLAKEGEDAAFAYDKRITNSEGATFTRAAGASAASRRSG